MIAVFPSRLSASALINARNGRTFAVHRAMMEGRCGSLPIPPSTVLTLCLEHAVPAAKAPDSADYDFPPFLLRLRSRFRDFDRFSFLPRPTLCAGPPRAPEPRSEQEPDPQEAHRTLRSLRSEDMPLPKAAGREDDRKARRFSNQGRPKKIALEASRPPACSRRTTEVQAYGVCS